MQSAGNLIMITTTPLAICSSMSMSMNMNRMPYVIWPQKSLARPQLNLWSPHKPKISQRTNKAHTHAHTCSAATDTSRLGNRMEKDLIESLIIIELPRAFLAPWLLFHGLIIFIPQIGESTQQIS